MRQPRTETCTVPVPDPVAVPVAVTVAVLARVLLLVQLVIVGVTVGVCCFASVACCMLHLLLPLLLLLQCAVIWRTGGGRAFPCPVCNGPRTAVGATTAGSQHAGKFKCILCAWPINSGTFNVCFCILKPQIRCALRVPSCLCILFHSAHSAFRALNLSQQIKFTNVVRALPKMYLFIYSFV